MKTLKLNSQKPLKNTDWKVFFDMRIFRYTFLKQLKSISTYVFFCLIIIASVLILCIGFSANKPRFFNETNSDDVKQLVKTSVSFYKISLYFLFMIVFALFITFKSLQIFRDEMDDGTLLVFSSMPFSRLKLIIQKWFSLQIFCLILVLSVIFILPIVFLTIQCFSMPSWEVTKILYKNSLNWTIGSIIFQILISTVAILISLYFGKTGTIGFLNFFYIVFVVLFCIPGIIYNTILGGNYSSLSKMTLKIKTLCEKSEQCNLFSYYKDPDLKDFFEMENWYTDQQIKNLNNPYNKQNHDQFEFTFEPEIIENLHDILSDTTDKDVEQKKESFLTKNIKVEIITSSSTSKAVKKILNLFKKIRPQTINLCPVRFLGYTYDSSNPCKVHEDDRKLIKSKETYKTALDNNDSFTQEEKKMIKLNKSLFEELDETNTNANKDDTKEYDAVKYDVEFVQFEQDTQTFVKSLAKQYEQKYPSTNTSESNNVESKINGLLKNKDTKKLVAYFIDDLAFQNLSFLMRTLFAEVVNNMYQTIFETDIIKSKEYIEKYFKIIKANSYLNIMTHIAFIWYGQSNSGFENIFLQNHYGEWEKEEYKGTNQNGPSKRMEYLKLKPESLKKIINPTLLYIIYPLISLSLVGLIIIIVNKRDFA